MQAQTRNIFRLDTQIGYYTDTSHPPFPPTSSHSSKYARTNLKKHRLRLPEDRQADLDRICKKGVCTLKYQTKNLTFQWRPVCGCLSVHVHVQREYACDSLLRWHFSGWIEWRGVGQKAIVPWISTALERPHHTNTKECFLS